MDTAQNPVPEEIDRPLASPPSNRVWGSDAIAAVLRALDIPYVALNPGASYRGLHDSLVNYLGNTRPRMLLCLHEESAVALAHGWAKVSERQMAVIVHSNVGLMHATMAIFNAWCHRPDRRDPPAAVDRMDPHRARPGRARAQFHQMGRSAGLGRRRPGGAVAGLADRQHRPQGPGLCQFRPRPAGRRDRRIAAAARDRPPPAAGLSRTRRPARAAGGGVAGRG